MNWKPSKNKKDKYFNEEKLVFGEKKTQAL